MKISTNHGGHNPTTTKPPLNTPSFQACAVCKFQRRRCSPNCLLAPYFPAHKHKEFLNAHKFFGVHNIVQMLKRAPEDRREEAAASLIYEANARAGDPAGGCRRIIRDLERRLHICTAELEMTLKLLQLYRSSSTGFADSNTGVDEKQHILLLQGSSSQVIDYPNYETM